MQKIFRFFLASGRKRRCLVVFVTLWLLRLLRDVENSDLERHSDKLNSFDFKETISLNYMAIEDEYLSCEYRLNSLESAIEELEFAY